MRTLTVGALSAALSALPDVGPDGPRVVVAGNHSVPWEALGVVEIDRGVGRERMSVRGFADTRRVELQGAPEVRRAANRRVVIRVE